MKSTERRLKLLMLIQSKQNWKVDDFAEYFGVSRRTIFRDFNTFSEIEVPIDYDQSKGYSVMKGNKIPPIMFSPKELSTILMGLSFASSQVDQTLVDDAKAVEVKIRNVLPSDDLIMYLDNLRKKTIVDPYKRQAMKTRSSGDWFTISNAIARNHRVSLMYPEGGKNHPEERKVDPYLIVYYTDHWTLIGYCHMREDVRSFRLERIDGVEILPETYNTKKVPSEEELLFRISGPTKMITLHVKPKSLRQLKLTLPAKIEEEKWLDKSTVSISFQFDNLEYINEWLLQFGNGGDVFKPLALNKIRDVYLREMLGKK